MEFWGVTAEPSSVQMLVMFNAGDGTGVLQPHLVMVRKFVAHCRYVKFNTLRASSRAELENANPIRSSYRLFADVAETG
jgi:hypothetical protein